MKSPSHQEKTNYAFAASGLGVNFRILSALLILALFAAGCAAPSTAAPSPTSTREANAAATVTPTAEPVSTLSVDPSALRGLTITVWHPWFGAEQALFDSQVAKFNTNNEWDITVLSVSQSNYNELFRNTTSSLASPDRPNLVVGLPEYAVLWYSQSGVLDLTPYVSDPTWGLSQSDVADFPSVFWEQDQLDGKRLAMPAQRSARFLFYNQSWARQLGFDSAPATAEEFRAQACAANQAMRANATPADDGFGGWYIDSDPMTAFSWMLALGGTPLEGDGYRFLTPKNQQALGFLRKLADETCAWQSPTVTAADAFATRQALFVSGGLEDLPAQSRALASHASADEWTVIPYPADTLVTYGSSFIELPSTEEKQLATWLFMRWLLSPENQAEWVRTTGLFPLRTSTLSLLAEYAASNPQWLEAAKLIPSGQTMPKLASWRVVRVALGDGFGALFAPDAQVPAVLAQLDKIVSEVTK